MEKNLRLAIILLNWNSAIDTVNSVAMISRWSGLQAGIIVVDNFSSEEDISLLQQSGLSFCLIKNNANLGYAGGCNIGIIRAIVEGYRTIMLLNSDVTISEPCMMKMLKFIEKNSDLGVIGPLLDEGGVIFAGGRNIGLYSRTRIPYRSELKELQFIEVDYVPGTAMLARREVFESIGQLDEDYFFSGEIADFCWRVWSAGLKCAVYTGCKATHSQETDSKMRDTLYNYYILRNRFIFIRRNFNYSKLALGARWIFSGALQILIAMLKGNNDRALALWLGLWDGICGTTGDRNAYFIN